MVLFDAYNLQTRPQNTKRRQKALSYEFLPTAKGLSRHMDLLVAQPPVNHSLPLKPLDKATGLQE